MAAPAQRVPPQDLSRERTILAEVLESSIAVRAAMEAGLAPEHFYSPSNGLIYGAMQHVAAAGDELDEAKLWKEIGRLDLAGGGEGRIGRSEINDLLGKSTNPFAVGQWARELIELASERRKLRGAHLIQEAVFEPVEQRSREMMAEGMACISTDYEAESQPTTRQELADDFFHYLDQEEPAECFKLPWSDLNECVLGGYRRQQTSVLAGWSGFGKSWALDQMMGGFSDQGYKVGIFATEMSHRERVARFVSARTGVPAEALMLKKLTPDQMARAVAALPKIPYDYHEVSGWSEDRIAQQISFGGYDVAAIDVINLIPQYEEKTEHASRIVARFMALAVRANMHIILVSHLNKERDKMAVKPPPVKRDLRQTGMLEANAHQILFLHRDQVEEGESIGELRDTGRLTLAKVRNGMTGHVDVIHNPTHLTFDNHSRRDEGDDFFARNEPRRAA